MMRVTAAKEDSGGYRTKSFSVLLNTCITIPLYSDDRSQDK